MTAEYNADELNAEFAHVAMCLYAEGASRQVTPIRGRIYLHRHYMGEDRKPLPCKVTKIAQGIPYYRPYYGLHDDGSEWLGRAWYVLVEKFGESFADGVTQP
jgi:hypothetical protein